MSTNETYATTQSPFYAFKLGDANPMKAEEAIALASDGGRSPSHEEVVTRYSKYAEALGCDLESMSLIDSETVLPDFYERLIKDVKNLENHGEMFDTYATATIREVPVVLTNECGLGTIYFEY